MIRIASPCESCESTSSDASRDSRRAPFSSSAPACRAITRQVDEPTGKVHADVDGVGRPVHEHERRYHFRRDGADAGENEGRPQARNEVSAGENLGQDVNVGRKNDAPAQVAQVIMGECVGHQDVERDHEPVGQIHQRCQ